MTALEALAGAGMVVAAIAGATRYRPGKDSRLKLALILTLATAGGWLTLGKAACEAAREIERATLSQSAEGE